jgi:hypothetical protein
VSDTVTQATDSSVTGWSTRVEVSDRGSDGEPCGGQVSATVSDTSAAAAGLSDAVDLIRRSARPLSGSGMAKEMALRGHPMSERTGLRWRNRADEDHRQRQLLVAAS